MGRISGNQQFRPSEYNGDSAMPSSTILRTVTSAQNAQVKALRRALSHGELVAGLAAVDSLTLIEEAAKSQAQIDTLFLSDKVTEHTVHSARDVLVLPDALFRSLVSVETSKGFAALIRPPVWEPQMILAAQRALLLVTAGVQDPGNLGTIIRSADAFGAAAVLTMKGTVSQWNSKTLRASAGSAFRLPVFSWGEIADLRNYGFAILAADSHRGDLASSCNLTHKIAIVIGNEGSGVPNAVAEQADGFIRIPHLARVESLNAAIAASLLLYEAFRQRHYRDGGT
ncbi:MAG: RNA methyltransferase [Acidobacteriaceae bacterium]